MKKIKKLKVYKYMHIQFYFNLVLFFYYYTYRSKKQDIKISYTARQTGLSKYVTKESYELISIKT